MTRFQSCALLAYLVAAAKAQNLRISESTQHVNRNLSFEFIAGYRPESQVTDHNAIDLDQQVIEAQIGAGTNGSFENAKAVYEEGGHSKSHAKLTLVNGASATFTEKAEFTGIDTLGNDVIGKVYKASSTPPGQLWLQYKTSDIQSTYVGCRVGALAKTGDAQTDGCFAETGTVSDGTNTYQYTYNIENDNDNGRTIKGFSTAVQGKMIEGCPGCPYRDAAYFKNYYGDSNYADKWVTAALTGGQTSFASGRGDADFSKYGLEGRGECAKKGTAYMNIFMYVIREFEDALDDCKEQCIKCNDDPVHAWDEGVAFYSGSLEGEDGVPSGKLLHQLADKRCGNFKTCLEDSTTAKVNDELFQLFNVGQGQLLVGNCKGARETKDKIVDIMYIPLIQGTLRYAYKVDKLQGGEKEKAEGAVFAAAVLPRIYAADEEAANTIYNNMKVDASSTEFKPVKDAFESVYGDLNINCDDIGGLLDKEGNYYEGMEPCKSKGKKAGATVGIVIGSVGAAIAVASVGYIFFLRGREKQGKPVFKPSTDERAI